DAQGPPRANCCESSAPDTPRGAPRLDEPERARLYPEDFPSILGRPKCKIPSRGGKRRHASFARCIPCPLNLMIVDTRFIQSQVLFIRFGIVAHALTPSSPSCRKYRPGVDMPATLRGRPSLMAPAPHPSC